MTLGVTSEGLQGSAGHELAGDPGESDLAFLREPLPANVLKLLFGRIGVGVQAGALAHACTEAQRELIEAPPTERVGLVLRALSLEGVAATQLRWTRFDRRRLPAMVFFEGEWQLVERAQGSNLRLTDSDGATRDCSEDDLDSSHMVLWLRAAEPTRDEIFSSSLKGNLAARLVLSEVFRSRRWLREVLVATTIVNVLAVSTSVFAMQVYDRVVPTLAYATLWTLATGMVLIIGLDWLLKTVRARTLDSVSCSVDKAVSQRVFDHLMGLRLDAYPRSLGSLAAQVSGLDSVRQFFTSGVIFALADMPFALMFIGFIAIVGGKIAWVYLLLLPVAVALGWITQKQSRRLMEQQMIRSNERQGLLVDAIRGVETVRANSAGWRFSQEWKEVTASINRFQIQQKAISNRATVTTGSLASVAHMSALIVGVGQIEAGNLTMGALIACSILGGRVIAPVSQAIQYMSQWQNVSQSMRLVNQLLRLETERRPEQNLLMPSEAPDRIELEGVRFSYPGSPVQQLDIPELRFQAGDRVVVLGPVGSGKSTLLKVLAGLYRPGEGRVRLGNADLWEMDPDLVADHVSYLPQSVHLFKGNLRSNLALSGAVSDSHLLEVSRELGIDRIADQNPLGMDLEISEGGEGLSGGQRQLLGLGRVFLAEPTIWLLDEPTASLDAESERQVIQALNAHLKDDDILLISTHRPALAAQLAKRVLAMRQGSIVADGPPETVIPKVMGGHGMSRAPRGRRPGAAPPGSPKRGAKLGV